MKEEYNVKKAWTIILAAFLVLFALSALAADKSLELISKEVEQEWEYESDTLRVEIRQWYYQYKKSDLRFFVADIYVEDPKQLMASFAYDEYSAKHTEITSDLAERHGAILAINGDYYNHKDRFKHSLIIRNGVLYREDKSNVDQLLVTADGSFVTLPKGQFAEGTGQDYVDQQVWQCFAFGPTLVENGEITEFPEKYIISLAPDIFEPRTAIGWAGENHYVAVVVDGRRKSWSTQGMSLQQLQALFKELGVQVAYNLDGGGTTTLYFNGEVLNRPSSGRQRETGDIIYFVDGAGEEKPE